MSNESNRQTGRNISPSDLQASDFFPPGHGWNKEGSEHEQSSSASKSRERDEREQDSASDGKRPH